MNELAVIFVMGFAILGVYFLFETSVRLFTRQKCSKVAVLFLPQTDTEKVDLLAEVSLLRNSCPNLRVICCANADSCVKLKEAWCSYGIEIVDSSQLQFELANYKHLQTNIKGV